MTRRRFISNADKAVPPGATLDGADPDILVHAEHFRRAFRELRAPTLNLSTPEDALKVIQIVEELRSALEGKRRAARLIKQELQDLKARIEAAARPDEGGPGDLEQ